MCESKYDATVAKVSQDSADYTITPPTMSNDVLRLSLESGGLASLARPPGITYLMICSTALTPMHLRTSLRHFSSNTYSTQTDNSTVITKRVC